VPDTAMVLPIRTAREMPRIGSYGDPEDTFWRAIVILPLS
jgi:hypothetical protein